MRSLTRFFTACLCLVALNSLNAQCEIEGYTYGGTYNGHHYYVSDGNADWPTANAAATALGGYLATISDAGENAFVAGIAWTYAADPGEGDPGAWIGLNDIVTEGTFVWANGDPVVYTSWGAFEPNNGEYGDGNGEDWVEINRNGLGLWNDLPWFVNYIEYVVELEDDAFDSDQDCDGVPDLCDGVFDDADCDGVGDGCDNCDGGDDNGPCDAETFPGLENVPDEWICHSNDRKVYVCHDGMTLCIDYNAVQAHLDHGDFLGPCTSCVEERSSSIKEGLEFNLYPNPAIDQVVIALQNPVEVATVTIYDKLGRVVFDGQIETGETDIRVSLEKYLTGEHFVQVVSANEVLTKKLMVLK